MLSYTAHQPLVCLPWINREVFTFSVFSQCPHNLYLSTRKNWQRGWTADVVAKKERYKVQTTTWTWIRDTNGTSDRKALLFFQTMKCTGDLRSIPTPGFVIFAGDPEKYPQVIDRTSPADGLLLSKPSPAPNKYKYFPKTREKWNQIKSTAYEHTTPCYRTKYSGVYTNTSIPFTLQRWVSIKSSISQLTICFIL